MNSEGRKIRIRLRNTELKYWCLIHNLFSVWQRVWITWASTILTRVWRSTRPCLRRADCRSWSQSLRTRTSRTRLISWPGRERLQPAGNLLHNIIVAKLYLHTGTFKLCLSWKSVLLIRNFFWNWIRNYLFRIQQEADKFTILFLF